MRFQAIIFDCDGVLIDSEVIANQTERDYFADFGLEITTEEFMARYVGLSFKDMISDIQARVSRPVPSDVEAIVHKKIIAAFKGTLNPISGIEELVTSLTLPKAVASSSSIERLEFTLRLTELWDLFAPHIYSSSMVSRGKPAPDLFLLAAEKLGVEPGDCLVVEDSPLGVQGAKAAGMTVIGFVGGSHCGPDRADRLMNAGASFVANATADILSWIATN
ncbi:MAG: HAD family phosphatase [Fimbriimonadaceae bacterium]